MNADERKCGISYDTPRVAQAALVSILTLSGIVVFAMAWFGSGVTEPSPPPLPSRIFTEEQVAAIKKELADWQPVDDRFAWEEKQRQEKIADKYYNATPELMALFHTVEEDNVKAALLQIICHRKKGRKDIIEFLEKALSRDVESLQGEYWILDALDYLERWNVPVALRVASRLLQHQDTKNRIPQDAVRSEAIGILRRHGRDEALVRKLTRLLAGLQPEAGSLDNKLYREVEQAITGIQARQARPLDKNMPCLEFGEIRVINGWPRLVFCLSNPSAQTFTYLRDSEENIAVAKVRQLRDGKWSILSFERFCDVGSEQQELPPNASVEIYESFAGIGAGFSIGVELSKGTLAEFYASIDALPRGAKHENRFLVWSFPVSEDYLEAFRVRAF